MEIETKAGFIQIERQGGMEVRPIVTVKPKSGENYKGTVVKTEWTRYGNRLTVLVKVGDEFEKRSVAPKTDVIYDTEEFQLYD